VPRTTIRDAAYQVLASSRGPANYRDVAEQMQRAGFQPPRSAKNPEGQLRRSVWVALTRDDRVVKVGPGVFDVADRKRTR
jgi:hypothetical protein